MDNLIFPMVSTVILILVVGIAYILFMRITEKEKERSKAEDKGDTAADFTNVLDIDGENSIVYTADNMLISCIRIEPVSLNLMTEGEKMSMANHLTMALSKYQHPWKIIAISRPVDTKPLMDKYNTMYKEIDDLERKKLLRNAVRTLEQLSIGGDVAERMFYFVIWDNFDDDISVKNFVKKRNQFLSFLSETSYRFDLATKTETIRLFNLYFNPSAVNYDDYSDIDDDIKFSNV